MNVNKFITKEKAEGKENNSIRTELVKVVKQLNLYLEKLEKAPDTENNKNLILKTTELRDKYAKKIGQLRKPTNILPNDNYYAILGLNRSASTEDITKKYRKLALQYHPNKQSGKSNEEKEIAKNKFQKISKAYTALTQNK